MSDPLPHINVLALCHKDAALALANAEWTAELESSPNHAWLVASNQEAVRQNLVQPVVDALKRRFKEVHTFTPHDEIEAPWPRSQNHMWTSVARHVRKHFNCPWFWMEADAFFLKDYALDTLWDAYRKGGQPFMGMLVKALSHDGKPVPEHMSGVSIYPAHVAKYCPSALLSHPVAFDMIVADAAIPNMHATNLIQHVYLSPPFTSYADFNRIEKTAVVYHQCKDFSLRDLLRQQREFNKPKPHEIPNIPKHEPRPIAVSGPTTDIFIKSYPADYEWLRYCIRSIEKFATGFRRVIVVSPDTAFHPDIPATLDRINRGAIAFVTQPDREPGYQWQQAVKLEADKHTDADFILYMDSDLIFTRPVTPQTFMHDGKPIWLKTPWEHVQDAGARNRWFPCMHQFFGKAPAFEYMRRHCFLVPRGLLNAVREVCDLMHAMPLTEYVMTHDNFSEFNVLGFLADLKFRDRFHWIDTSINPVPEPTVLQHWSKGGLTDEIRAKLEEYLMDTPHGTRINPAWAEASDEIRAKLESNIMRAPSHTLTVIAEHEAFGAQTVTPRSSIAEAIALLKAEADKSNIHKARITKSLRCAGLVPKKAKPRRK